MIQFKRGTTKSWRGTKTILEPGQPGFDKEKHKIKIGDGVQSWTKLPYASGLFAEEIIDSEATAKAKRTLDVEDKTLITYGEEAPDNTTVGTVYLQHYDSEPEVDYIVSSGINGIWAYQLWKSGIAKCWGTQDVTSEIQNDFENIGLFYDNKMKSIAYPITFKATPTETATLQSPGGIAWLASRSKNTKKASGTYTFISPDKQLTSAKYSVSLHVEGFWR